MTDKLPPSKFGAGYTYGGPSPIPSQTSPPPPSSNHPASASNYHAAQPTAASYGSAALSDQAPITYGSFSSPGTPIGPVAHAPNATMAIAAGVLTFLTAVYLGWKAFGSIQGLRILSDFGIGFLDGDTKAYFIATAAISAVGALLSAAGAVMLLSRRLSGRNLVTLGCLCAIAIPLVEWVYAWHYAKKISDSLGLESDLGSIFSSWVGISALISALSMAVPLIAMILALSGSTRSWCEAPRYVTFQAPGPY